MITSIEYCYVHSSERFHTFHRMFYNMPQIIFEYFLDCLRTFPEMFNDISRNVWRHFPECLRTFPRMFEEISRNIWRHFPESLRTFPGMFEDIPRNVWRHSPECLATYPRIKHFPHSPRSPHFVPRSCIPGFIYSRLFSFIFFTHVFF